MQKLPRSRPATRQPKRAGDPPSASCARRSSSASRSSAGLRRARLGCRQGQVLARAGQGLHMARPGDEDALGHGLPARYLEQALAQGIEPSAGLGGQGQLARRWRRQVSLVEDLQDALRVNALQPRADAGVFGGIAGSVQRPRSCRKSTTSASRWRSNCARCRCARPRRRCPAQAGGVDDVQRHALDLQALAELVARGARDGRDDGQLCPGQGIEQELLPTLGWLASTTLRPSRNSAP